MKASREAANDRKLLASMGTKFVSNLSVRALMSESLPGEGPDDVIRRKARELVNSALNLNWEGPPFDPETLGSLLGIEILPVAEPIGSEARIFPKPDGTLRVEYDPSYPKTRTSFSICHEIAHTFFPDCYETVRHRNKSTAQESRNQELESLCDIGAAELLMPVGPFCQDLHGQAICLKSILNLADRYGASIEAVLIRAAQFGETAFCTVVLSERFKPTELREMGTPSFDVVEAAAQPKLRVDYPSASSEFNVFIPKHKSAPAGSVAYQALLTPGVHEARETWEISGLGRRRVEAVALPAINRTRRVAVFFGDAD